MAARFARTIRDLLVPPPVVPTLDEHVDPEIVRVEWAIARLPKRTREVFLMHRFENLGYDRIAHRYRFSCFPFPRTYYGKAVFGNTVGYLPFEWTEIFGWCLLVRYFSTSLPFAILLGVGISAPLYCFISPLHTIYTVVINQA